jgi:hypothetical protein
MYLCLSGNPQQLLTQVRIIHPVCMLSELRHSAVFCAVGITQMLEQLLLGIRMESS